MWGILSGSSKVVRPTVLQTLPGEVANTLKTSGPTAQALTDLAALSFVDVNAMREFVLDVAPQLTAEQIDEIVCHLAQVRLNDNGRNVKDLLTGEGLARSFLAYQFVHHKEYAVAHIKSGGVIYSALGWVQLGVLTSGTMAMPEKMPEVAFFLFKKKELDYSASPNDAATLRSDRDGSDAQTQCLNAIDKFIIKYFIAELDETRKEQADRKMEDERGGYRGGRKVSVGLDVRHQIITCGVTNAGIAAVFKQALSENNISYDDFFAGGTKKFLPEPLFSILEAARPTTAPGCR